MEQSFAVPLYIRVGKKKPKNVWLNLSNYRNWDYRVNNSYKIAFKKTIASELAQLEPMKGLVDVRLKIWYPTRLKRDLDNSMSVLTKFTLDALVESGILEEDNIEFIRSIHGSFDGYDKHFPRCEVRLRTVSSEDSKKICETVYL